MSMKPDRNRKPEQLADYPVVVELPIQWGDQDAFGHVNNIVAFRWFESSRIAYIEQSQVGNFMDRSGLGPILASVTCNYRRQLHYPDTVSIGSRVTKIGRTSMTIDHAVYSEKLQMITTDGVSTIVIFDYQANRPVRVPDELREDCALREGRSFDL
ncbi:MAG: acyl-CoA thioesterase [Mariniblastus sp.]|nr:acyl-CoA thioesterase [Mariniblastus sp.]